mgnify:CR=1 FL=1
MFAPAPFLLKDTSVSQVMTQVCIALVPGIAAYAWLVGPAILVQLVIATLAALLAETAMLRIQKKPLTIFLSDGSAVVTAWLIALTFPPLAPWWLVAIGTVFAIVVAKHLYGGLGQNPFNPAMVAFAVCIVSFPALMSQWPTVGLQLPLLDQINVILGLAPRVDALSSATPVGAFNCALLAGPLSPLKPQVPLPATVVRANTSSKPISSKPSAIKMAAASSWPGSVSMMSWGLRRLWQ